MAMRLTDTEDEAIVAEINITPLTDIFLVLLIIFMISSSAMLEGGLQVKLPSARAAAIAQSHAAKPIFITIAKDGRISVNDRVVGEDTLTGEIQRAVRSADDKTVVIRGDEGILLGKAVTVMDAARSAGAQKIAIATQPGPRKRY